MQIFTPVTQTDLKAWAQGMKLWLVEILAWMVEAIGIREGRIELNRMRFEARRELRELIFMTMRARMRFRKTEMPRQRTRPPSAPRGFHCVYRRLDMVRLYTRGIPLKTFADMRQALDELDRIVERAIQRVPRRIVTGRLSLQRSDEPAARHTLNDGALDRTPDTS